MIARGTCNCGNEVERELAEGAFAEIANKLPFRCSECSGNLERQWDDEDAESEKRAARERFEKKITTLPPALRDRRLGDLDTDGRANALEAARRWSRRELGGLVLLGDVGLGKTTIAAAAVRDYIARDLSRPTPRWVSTTQALTDLGRSFGHKHREAMIEALTSCDLPLVLDDLDKSKPTAAAALFIFEAIDACMTHNRPLLVTTNLTPDGLAARIPEHGRAIASRLVGYCELHRISGHDRRKA